MKTKETHLLTCKEFKRNNASERNAKERWKTAKTLGFLLCYRLLCCLFPASSRKFKENRNKHAQITISLSTSIGAVQREPVVVTLIVNQCEWLSQFLHDICIVIVDLTERQYLSFIKQLVTLYPFKQVKLLLSYWSHLIVFFFFCCTLFFMDYWYFYTIHCSFGQNS